MTDARTKYSYLKGKTCPYCQSPLKSNADVTICSSCGVPHHTECWNENSGCTTYGCVHNPSSSDRINMQAAGEDVGDRTLESIRESLGREGSDLFIECPNCRAKVEAQSTYCRHCGYNIKEERFDEAKEEFEKEFRRIYKDKAEFSKRRLLLTLASTVILLVSFSLLGYLTYKKINEHFASDAYQLRGVVERYADARMSEDPDRVREMLTSDYEYFGKDGKKQDIKDRLKRLEQIYKSSGGVDIAVSDFKVITDSTVSTSDKRVEFREEFRAGKINEKGTKTLRLYKGEETANEWKIYREIFEE